SGPAECADPEMTDTFFLVALIGAVNATDPGHQCCRQKVLRLYTSTAVVISNRRDRRSSGRTAPPPSPCFSEKTSAGPFTIALLGNPFNKWLIDRLNLDNLKFSQQPSCQT